MGRGLGSGSGPYVPRPRSVEVSDRHVKIRLLAAAICFVIAAASITYGVWRLTAVEKGWQTISASGEGAVYADDFVLAYELGMSEQAAKSEVREIRALYSAACLEAGKAFDTITASPGNLKTLNDSPDETLELAPALYKALELMERYGNRTAYLGPAFALYENVFSCQEDWQLADFDPESNGELAKLFGRIAAYARDPESVEVELLGENRARLHVSEEYREFLEEEELGGPLGFGWMKNAFLVDEIADCLARAGYTRGNISSFDGFARNLDDQSGISYSLNIFDDWNGAAISAARLDYQGPKAFVSYRTFPVTAMDSRRIYVTAEGKRKTMYLSLEDGLPRWGTDSLTVYSDRLGCGELMLLTAPLFQKEKLSEEDLAALVSEGAWSVWAGDRRLFVTDPKAVLADVYDGYTAAGAPFYEQR